MNRWAMHNPEAYERGESALERMEERHDSEEELRREREQEELDREDYRRHEGMNHD